MSTHFNYDCPHCLTRGAGFEVTYQWRPHRTITDASMLAVCGICKGGMTLLSEFRLAGNAHPDLVREDVPYPGERFIIRATWPRFAGRCPADVPPNVESFYNQGLENLSAGRWDAAGAMFRKSLDVATKIIAPDKRSKTLFARINELVTEGRLTEAIGEWAHEIRLDGNDAVHDDEPESDDDAAVMRRFAEAVLTYSFTLPALVATNRAKRHPANDAASGAVA